MLGAGCLPSAEQQQRSERAQARERQATGLKRNEKRKSGIANAAWPQTTPRTRNWSLTAPATLRSEQAVAALPCIQHILDANRLTWSDVGHHPDCQCASFIHASQQQEPTWDLIMDTRRKYRNWLRRNPPHDFFPEAWTKRCNEYSIFNPGLVTTKRREGDEHTLRGLAGVYQCRINIIVVSSNHHHTKTIPLPCRNNPLLSFSLISFPMFQATLSTIYIRRVL